MASKMAGAIRQEPNSTRSQAVRRVRAGTRTRRAPSRLPVAVAIFGLLLSFAQAAFAESGTISPAGFATIYEDAPDANGGGYANLCVGNLSTDNQTRRAFVRYDLPAIPTGSTITRVRLEMLQEKVRFQGNGPLEATLEISRVTQAWTQGTGIACIAACGCGADVPGVDWTSQPVSAAPPSGSEDLSTADFLDFAFDTDTGVDDSALISDVQAWLDGDANLGWSLRVAEEGVTDNARKIVPGSLTVEWVEPAAAPMLSAPALAALALSLCTAAAWSVLRRRQALADTR